jgi:hypothetical protein
MKYLRINTKRKLRNLSWRMIPFLLRIDANVVIWTVSVASLIGLIGALV